MTQEKSATTHTASTSFGGPLRFLLMLLAAWTQLPAAIGTASLSGVVHDPTGAVVQGAAVAVTHLATGYGRVVHTTTEGRFTANTLPVGEFQIETTFPGFQTSRIERLILYVGAERTITITLALDKRADEVSVSEAVGVSDTVSSSSGALIPRSVIDSLPLRGRHFTELIQLTPGVVQESDRGGLVIAGQRSINSNIGVDGNDFNDPLQGNARGGNEAAFFFPQSAIAEFQVVRSGAGAQIGRTTAGFINVVTRSGSNRWNGESLYFHRNRQLTSPDAFGRSLDNRQDQFGGSAGGPVQKDRMFVFGAIEQNLLRVPFVVQFQPQRAGVVVPDHVKSQEGEYRGTNNPTALFVRTDRRLTPATSLNVQYSATRMVGENFNFDSPQMDDAASTNYSYRAQSHTFQSALVSAGSRHVNELRGQFATDNRDEVPNLSAPNIAIKGFGDLGGDPGRPRRYSSSRFQVQDNFSISFGRHTARMGFDTNLIHFEQRREANLPGRYDFKSLTDFIAGKFDRFRQTMPVAGTEGTLFQGFQRDLAIFVEDKLSFSERLTMNAGLRWDGQWQPQPEYPNPSIRETQQIPHDLAMWQPRVGLAWKPSKSDRTVLRVSAGLLSARTPATLFQRIFTNNGLATQTIDSKVDPSVLKAVRYPDALTAIPAGLKVAAPRVFGIDSSFRNPQSFQGSVTLEHQVGPMAISAGYIRNATWKLQRRSDRNLFQPTITSSGLPVFPAERPNPQIGWFSVNESSAHSSYDGLNVTVSGDLHPRLRIQGHYAFSTNYDDDSNERNFSRESALNPFDFSLERAYSKQDVRHNGNLSVLATLPLRLTLSTMLIARTGLPYTPVAGNDLQNDSNEDNDRAIIDGRVAPRNGFRQPGLFNLDLRASRTFRVTETAALEIFGDVFNATRAANQHFGNDGISVWGTEDAPLATAGLPLYAPSTARFGGPRQVQLGVRVRF
jgi:hypothetical protein